MLLIVQVGGLIRIEEWQERMIELEELVEKAVHVVFSQLDILQFMRVSRHVVVAAALEM
jgi:hypothetical protein